MTTFSNKINSRKLQLESLENRELLSVNPLNVDNQKQGLLVPAEYGAEQARTELPQDESELIIAANNTSTTKWEDISFNSSGTYTHSNALIYGFWCFAYYSFELDSTATIWAQAKRPSGSNSGLNEGNSRINLWQIKEDGNWSELRKDYFKSSLYATFQYDDLAAGKYVIEVYQESDQGGWFGAEKVDRTHTYSLYVMKCDSPKINTPPQSQSIVKGNPTQLSVAATVNGSNTGTLSYKWYQEGNSATVVGTESTLKVSSDFTTKYYCVITNTVKPPSGTASGSDTLVKTTTSSTATVTVRLPAPTNFKADAGTPNSDTSKSVKLQWDAVSGAHYYELQRSTSETFSKRVQAFGVTWWWIADYTILSNATGTSYTDSGLSAGTTYYYRVKAVYNQSILVSDSNYSTILSVTTPKITLKAPTLNPPTATSTSVALTWNLIPNASSYTLQRSTSSSFTTYSSFNTTNLSYTDNSVTAGTKYYYRVKAVGSGVYENSVDSNVVDITPPTIELTPKPVLSQGQVTSSSITVNWTSVPNASSYTLQRSTNREFSTYTTLTSGSKNTSYIDAPVSSGMTYYYRVQAVGTLPYVNSEWSDVIFATSSDVPTTPIVTITTNNDTYVIGDTVSLTAQVNNYNGTLTYQWKKSGSDTILSTEKTYSFIATAVGTSMYSCEVTNTINTEYETGSGSMTVIVDYAKLAKPEIVTPITTTNTTAAVNWSAVAECVSYILQYSTSSTFDSSTQINGLTDPTAPITGLTAGQKYYIRVKALGNGTTNRDSDWSETVDFTTSMPADAIGDSIADSYSISFTNNTFSKTQQIGDGIYGSKDVDMYKIVITSGDLINDYTFATSQADGQAKFDTFIRLFDASGKQILADDDGNDSIYSLLKEWKPAAAGTYYLGVSSMENSEYNPLTAGSGKTGSTGYYTLTITKKVAVVIPTALTVTITTPQTTYYVGDTEKLTANVTNANGKLKYQWQKDGFNIFGATAATYEHIVGKEETAVYSCVVENTTSGGTTVGIGELRIEHKSPIVQGQNYAVLFAGGSNAANNHSRYYESIKAYYTTLVVQYHLAPENIYILFADGVDPAADQNASQDYHNPRKINSDMSYATGNNTFVAPANLTNLNFVFTALGNKMGVNDHLLFYTFDHGGGSSNPATYGEETLTAWGSEIKDVQVASAIEKIQWGYITLIFNQCYSGGILDNIVNASGSKLINTNANIYGMAASTHYETSKSSSDRADGGGFGGAVLDTLKLGTYLTGADVFLHTTDPFAVAGEEHPWGAGATFSIFTAGAYVNTYSSNTLVNDFAGGDLLIANSATSNTAALELLAGNNVYINYAYSNPQNAAVSATATVYNESGQQQVYTINDAGTGSLAANFNLGVFDTGTYSVFVELIVGEDYLAFSDSFNVLASSADIADTLSAAKEITFDEYNTLSTTSFIGDGLYGGKDVDIYRFIVAAADIGKTLVFNTFGGTLLPTDTYIRLFDFDGNELAHSVLTGQNVVSTLYYTITTAGLYYLGVSALENTSYFPTNVNDGIAGTTGSYQLNGRISDTKANLTLNYDFSWIDNILWTNTATGTNRVEPNSSEDLYVNYKFANIGYAAAEAVTNRITITGANGYSVSHDFISSPIAAGGFQSLASNYKWGKLAAGDYTITVTLDVDNVLAELNEENNSASWSFTVTADDNVVAGKKDGTAQTSSVTAAFVVEDFNRIEEKNSKGKVTTTATSYIIKVYAWDAKTGKFKVAKTVTVKSTAANTVDGVLTYTLTGLKANTLYQITVQAKADAKTVYANGSKTISNPKGDVKTLGEVRTWAVVPNASLKASTATENSVNVKVSNWGTSGGLWTEAVAAGTKSAKVYTPIETDKATATVTKNISAVDTLLVTYSWSEVVSKKTIKHPTTATLTWDGSSWSSSDGVSFDTAKGMITIRDLSPSVKYTVQVQFSRSAETADIKAVAVKATSVSVSATARKFSAPVISHFQLTADKTAQVSFALSKDNDGRAATQYKVEFLTITNGKTKVAKTLTVDTAKTNPAWSFDGDSVTAYITGLTVYQVRVKALAATKMSTYNYTNIASDISEMTITAVT